MDIGQRFQDMGIDAITGVELMKSLGLSSDDFIDPARFERFKDVIDYFKNLPDRNYILNRLVVGKNVDKLDHIWGYTELSRQKEILKEKINSQVIKLDALNTLGDKDESTKFVESSLVEAKNELAKINEQISHYEN